MTTPSIEISSLPMSEYLEQPMPDVVQVKGHRIGLERIVELYQEGFSAEQITQEFPGVELEATYAIIAYYLHNQAAIDAYIARIDTAAAERYRAWASAMPEVSQQVRAVLAKRRPVAHVR